MGKIRLFKVWGQFAGTHRFRGREVWIMQFFAARLKNRSLLYTSSSGGIFGALSNLVISFNGAVVCASYNYTTTQTEYIIITSMAECNKAIGSKYMQSIPGDIFHASLDWLNNNPDKKLLFVGMGCQAAGFKSFIDTVELSDRVYIVDIICYGSPSPKLWKEYARAIEKNKGKITYLTFKDKRNGWKHPSAYVLVNAKEFNISDYVRIFYNRCALRPSCHICPYATTERQTDMTIGDFWGIDEKMPDFYNPDGNSLILIHTQKGSELFEAVKPVLEYRESNKESCLQPNLIRPTPVSRKRRQFWKDYQSKGIEYIMKKYGEVTIYEKVKNKIKKMLTGGI